MSTLMSQHVVVGAKQVNFLCDISLQRAKKFNRHGSFNRIGHRQFIYQLSPSDSPQVSTEVERVPKCSVEEILALESGAPFFVGHRKSHDKPWRNSLEEPLQELSQRSRHSTTTRLPPIPKSHHMTEGEKMRAEEQSPGVGEDKSMGEAFFMTQLMVSVEMV